MYFKRNGKLITASSKAQAIHKVIASSKEPKDFTFYFWPGSGYRLIDYKVSTKSGDIEEALNRAVVKAEKDNGVKKGILLEVDDVEKQIKEQELSEDDVDELWQYVDATMEGAKRPYYVYLDNLKVEEN